MKPAAAPAARADHRWTAAWAVSVVLAAVGLGVVGSHYSAPCTEGLAAEHDYVGCLTAGQFAGAFLLVAMLPFVAGLYAQTLCFADGPWVRAAGVGIFAGGVALVASGDVLWIPVGVILCFAFAGLLAGGRVRVRLAWLLPFWAASTMTFAPVWNKAAKEYWASEAHTDTLVEWLSPVLVEGKWRLKTYEDACIYFGWFAGLLLFKRFVPPRWRERALVAYVALLFVLWTWFWAVRFDGITLQAEDPFTGDETQPRLQRWARVFGHLSSLSLSLLLFPVTGATRSVKWHRWMGLVAWLCITVHLLLWEIKWSKQGILLHNLWTWNNLAVTKTWINTDNITIPFVTVSYIFLSISLLLALRRRDNYHAFRLAHRAGIAMYFMAIWHAWCFWYYSAGGMVLFLVDYGARTRRGARAWRAQVQADVGGGVLELSVPREALAGARPGQYAFVSVPAVSSLEFHPFSVSSPTTFHIGACKFQGRLAALVGEAGEVEVRIDGFYGDLGARAAEFDSVLLVAGGIGITPLRPLFLSLREQRVDVKLVWAVRSPDFGSVFAELPAVVGHPPLAPHIEALPKGSSSLVVVCGPMGMVEEVQGLAKGHGVLCEWEEFYF